MNELLLPYLCCPVDRGPLVVESGSEVDGAIIRRGNLLSAAGRRYPIVEGIPDLTVGFQSAEEEATVGTFGREWARYDDFEGAMGSADLFGTFSGLTADDVRGKRVLEVGCGGGRWLKVMAELGAERVVGLEMSGAVRQAARRTASLTNVDIVRGSAMQMPFARAFDLVVSIGVVHHLSDPVLGIRNVGKVVRNPHMFVFWVYAREGNRLYLALVQPLRRLTKPLPDPALAWTSRAMAAVLWAHIRSVNKLAVTLSLPMPLRDYLVMLAPLRFRDLESVVYDQLAPQIARYPTATEVRSWVEAGGGTVRRLHHRTNNSWQCHCQFSDGVGA